MDFSTFVFKLKDDDEMELARLQIADDTENMSFDELSNYVQTVLEPGKIGWNHKSFDNFLKKEREFDSYKQTVPDLEEGVLQCKRCSSKRVFSFQTQARSADEPMTTVAKCSKCGFNWTENN